MRSAERESQALFDERGESRAAPLGFALRLLE
jgi:hypothetical protein